MDEIAKDRLYGKDKDGNIISKKVPKIAFLQQQILARMKALEDPNEDDFYTDDDGALVAHANAKYHLKRESLVEELAYAKEFLVELQLPVNDGWAGGHCCAYGAILIRC